MTDFIKNYLSEIHAGIAENVYDLGDGETLVTFSCERLLEFSAPLSDMGFRAVKRFSVGNTDGTFYESGDERTVYVYTNPGLSYASAVLGAALPPSDSAAEPIYDDTILHQFATRAEDEPYPGGMTYLIRLCDGRFIIIDGGFECKPKELIDTMGALHPRADKEAPYEVAAWIFTHPHDDHVQLFFRIHEDSSLLEKLHISRVIANSACDAVFMERCESSIGDSRKLRALTEALCERGTVFSKPHTGMSFTIGELDFDVFFTQNEWTVSDMIYLNDASTVFSMSRAGGRKIMMLGDIMEFAGDYIMRMYTPSQLKADAVQVAHHAVRGPDIEIYKAIDPKLCLWTMQQVCYDLFSTKFERNVHLRELDAFHVISCFGPAQITL